MAVSVKFGVNTSDNRCLRKSVTWGTTYPCDIYQEVDRINPSLLVDKDLINIESTNYMWINEFGRYYYITSITGGPGNRVIVDGHVDVLYTYADQIEQCECIAERSTSHANLYLPDDRRLFNAYVCNQYKEIYEFNVPDTIVLTTIGAGSDDSTSDIYDNPTN